MLIYLTHMLYIIAKIDMITNIKKVDPETPDKTSMVANAEATYVLTSRTENV